MPWLARSPTKALGEFASFCGDSGDGRSVLCGFDGKAQQLLHDPVHLFVVHNSMLCVRGLMTTAGALSVALERPRHPMDEYQVVIRRGWFELVEEPTAALPMRPLRRHG